MSNGKSKASVVQGTLDLMVLQILDSMGPCHGYAVAARVEQVSDGALQLNMGTLYPALMRLEQRRLSRGKMGHDREQPPGSVLQPDRRRPTGAGQANAGLGSQGRHHIQVLLRGEA